MGGWASACARRSGTRHLRAGARCEDALCLRHAGPAGSVLVAALADGAGSAPCGGAGAAVAARVGALSVARAVHGGLEGEAEAMLSRAMAEAGTAVAAAAAARDRAPRDLATTLILVVSDGARTLAAHVGDGAVVLRTPEGWRVLSWPMQGAYAGSTDFLTDANPAIRIADVSEPISAVAAFTDGMERLILDFGARKPHGAFFERMVGPVARLDRPGRDVHLSAALGRYLDGESVCARTDDDKTLLLAVTWPPTAA